MKSILKKIGAGKVYAFVVRQYDRFFSSRIECSIGDIVLQRGIPSNNQLLLTSRLLDVENYIGSDNQTFPYQNLISYKKYGKNHKEEQGNLHFKELIESYRQYGYDTNSLITCDCDLSLMDGNHRMGLHLFQKIEEVNVRVIKRKAIKEYGGDWYYRMNVPTAIMENLYNKYNEIQQWLITTGNTFCAVLFSNNEDIVKNTILDMSRLTNVLKVSHLRGGVFLCLSFNDPKYVVDNGKLVSQRALYVESIIHNRITPEDNFYISRNCLEGKTLHRKYFQLEDEV